MMSRTFFLSLLGLGGYTIFIVSKLQNQTFEPWHFSVPFALVLILFAVLSLAALKNPASILINNGYSRWLIEERGMTWYRKMTAVSSIACLIGAVFLLVGTLS